MMQTRRETYVHKFDIKLEKKKKRTNAQTTYIFISTNEQQREACN